MLRQDADHFVDLARQRNPLDPSVALGPLVIPVLVAPGLVKYAVVGPSGRSPAVSDTGEPADAVDGRDVPAQMADGSG